MQRGTLNTIEIDSLHQVAVLRGVREGIVPGPALMIAKRGPTPKKKDRHRKNKGPADVFGPGPCSPQTATVYTLNTYV